MNAMDSVELSLSEAGVVLDVLNKVWRNLQQHDDGYYRPDQQNEWVLDERQATLLWQAIVKIDSQFESNIPKSSWE
jgi:hypothetical protein